MIPPTTPEVKSVADAIDQGVALANTNGAPPLPAADDAETEGGTTDANSSPDPADKAGTEGAPETVPAAAKSTEAGTDPGTAADGSDSKDGEAAGDDTEGDDAARAAEAAAAAAADPAKAGKPPAKPDPLTDPIPNALKPATKERIRTLVDRTKTAETSLATVTGERDELIKAITDTGATPEQYSGMLDYMELVNSKDRNKLIQAANFMIRELSALSRVGGFRIPGVTTYSGHKDLEAAVTEGKLTQELAEEIAAGRAAQAHQGKIGAAQQQESEARQRYQEADKKARADMNVMEVEFAKDPLYKEKRPIILGLLNEVIRGDAKSGVPPLHPSKWASAYKRIYETLPKTLGGMKPVTSAAKIPTNTPLRTQQPAGAQKQEPKSVAEALDMGIELARGG